MGTHAGDLQTLSLGLPSARVIIGIAGHLPITDTWIALLVGVLGGFANVALRRRPAVAQT